MIRLVLTARVVLVLAASCLAPAGAQTSQQCFTTNVPMSPTNWNAAATVPRFDTALGTLSQVDFTLTADIQGSAVAESLIAAPVIIQLVFQANMSLRRPDQSVITIAHPNVVFNDPLGAFDGTIDFMGPSGVTHSAISATASISATSLPSDLALFSGPVGIPGTIDLPMTAVGTSTLAGGGNVVVGFLTNAAATVRVCYTFLPNAPPAFTPGSPCGLSLMSSVGVPLVFTVCAGDSDPLDFVTLTSGALPAGTSVVPALPAGGNPICVTFSWTPTASQLGTFQLNFTATDSHLRVASCSINVLPVGECYQAVGRGSGGATFSQGGATFGTHLGSVRLVYPVTMAHRPSLKIPSLSTGQIQFSMQTLMYNPVAFPANPDQWSQRLRVTILPDEMVLGDLFDTFNGIHQGLATFTDPVGERYMTFPFTIDGM